MEDKEVARILQNSLTVNEELRRAIQELRPKAEIWDKLTETNGAIDMQEAANSIKYRGIGRNTLFSILRGQKVLQSSNMPYRRYIDSEHFIVIEQSVYINGKTVLRPKTLVTPKGIQYIKKILDKLGHGDIDADTSR